LNAIIERNDSGMTLASYVRGLSYGGGIGGIISKITPTTADYYHYDGIGGVTGLTDSTGQIIQSYTYDAYGNLLTPQSPSPHGFSTKEYSAKSGLIYFGARYYDPRVGRWITKEPMPENPFRPETLHRYTYCNNNSVNNIDFDGDFPTGKSLWSNIIDLLKVYEKAKELADEDYRIKREAIEYEYKMGLEIAKIRRDNRLAYADERYMNGTISFEKWRKLCSEIEREYLEKTDEITRKRAKELLELERHPTNYLPSDPFKPPFDINR